ncbi:Phosphatidylinositol phosphatase PTPRQ-like [Homarus americanus]|uniref:Phosphatidylinositol phosphatase PTPRQ-like n=1 Tax=Homarus americanus TaxID=6706 RepID=A0A8J5K108_HOMAM|nr:Phosphatidylinositol phosphatase PTPRQ-like [Homarus americanus]
MLSRGLRTRLTDCYQLSVVLLLVFILCVDGSALHLRVTRAGGVPGPEVEVTWTLPTHHPGLTLTWSSLTYTSQMTSKEVGNHLLENTLSSYTINEGLKYDQQYRVCLKWEAAECEQLASVCSFLKVPRLPQSKAHKGGSLYLVMGPVHSKNLSVVWGQIPTSSYVQDSSHSTKGFRITWRRVEGRVGHPGHASNLVSSKHLIRGLIPGTRYEVCVGETHSPDDQLICDVITTAEDVPGPPETEGGSCGIQARGTHWLCDVTWTTPEKTHGKIIGYLVEWKDREGYVLMESIPRGVLCEPHCYHSQVVNFHPSEVCVSARTRAGQGWESCVPIHDVSGRILAFFELKVMLIIGVTVVSYQLGPTLVKALLRCW